MSADEYVCALLLILMILNLYYTHTYINSYSKQYLHDTLKLTAG